MIKKLCRLKIFVQVYFYLHLCCKLTKKWSWSLDLKFETVLWRHYDQKKNQLIKRDFWKRVDNTCKKNSKYCSIPRNFKTRKLNFNSQPNDNIAYARGQTAIIYFVLLATIFFDIWICVYVSKKRFEYVHCNSSKDWSKLCLSPFYRDLSLFRNLHLFQNFNLLY